MKRVFGLRDAGGQGMDQIFLSYGVNYLEDDKPLKSMLEYLKFSIDTDLVGLGSYVSTKMIDTAYFVDRFARPYLHRWSVIGNEINFVHIAPDHKKVLYDLLSYGIVKKTIEGSRDLLYHFVSGYLISDAGFFCSITLTEQTAYGLWKYGDPDAKEKYLGYFLRDIEPWMGATFYTEVQAGSDLGGLETRAVERDGKWLLNGIKYFASNVGLADAAIITAKPDPPRPGAKGVAAFFAPAYREDGSPNWKILRLKDKLGTITVPTGEVELRDSLAYALGSPNQGVYIALEILTIARIDNSLAAMGLARKALWEAYMYSVERRAFGKRLIEHPLYLRDLMEREAELEAYTLLALIAAKSFSDLAKAEKPPYTSAYNFARLLTHIAKNLTAWASIEITRYAMEMLGGVGFLEEYPLAKIHRDALVTAIWEGTSNIQSLDMLELFIKKNFNKILFEEIKSHINNIKDNNIRKTLETAAAEAVADIEDALRAEAPEWHAKYLVEKLGKLLAAVYYHEFAEYIYNLYKDSGPLILSNLFIMKNLKNNKIDSSFIKKGAEVIKWMAPLSRQRL